MDQIFYIHSNHLKQKYMKCDSGTPELLTSRNMNNKRWNDFRHIKNLCLLTRLLYHILWYRFSFSSPISVSFFLPVFEPSHGAANLDRRYPSKPDHASDSCFVVFIRIWYINSGKFDFNSLRRPLRQVVFTTEIPCSFIMCKGEILICLKVCILQTNMKQWTVII